LGSWLKLAATVVGALRPRAGAAPPPSSRAAVPASTTTPDVTTSRPAAALALRLPPAGTPDPWLRAPDLVSVDGPGLLAGLQPRGRPLLVHHWAAAVEASRMDLPMLQALRAAQGPKLDVVGVSWDPFLDAPLGRNPEMLGRPARWADGSEARALFHNGDLSWVTLLPSVDAATLLELVGLPEPAVPQTVLYGADGAVLLHQAGRLDAAVVDRLTGLLEKT
jgi:hypothetical protein